MATSFKNGHKESPPSLEKFHANIVVSGERRCGKTRLIRSFHSHHFSSDVYSHNGVRIFPCEFRENRHHYKVSVFEIPGDHDLYPEERILHYFGADVIVFVYAIDDPVSLQMLIEKWIPEAELAINIHERPVVFVGTKRDLQNDQQVINRLALQNQSPVTFQQAGVLLSQVSSSVAIFQCSTIDVEQIHRVFYAIFQFIDFDNESEDEESVDDESLDEESVGEESLEEESVDEESLGEESLDEESVGEKSLDEESG